MRIDSRFQVNTRVHAAYTVFPKFSIGPHIVSLVTGNWFPFFNSPALRSSRKIAIKKILIFRVNKFPSTSRSFVNKSCFREDSLTFFYLQEKIFIDKWPIFFASVMYEEFRLLLDKCFLYEDSWQILLQNKRVVSSTNDRNSSMTGIEQNLLHINSASVNWFFGGQRFTWILIRWRVWEN